jgi:TetR/AcrR family transcriptional regulator, transcriptional repressor for nem operon
MIFIMRKENHQRANAKAMSHERIVATAARAIRRSGYDGTGVADIMKEAGLTHGAFYAHFSSREAMLLEATDHASAQSQLATSHLLNDVPPQNSLESLIAAYLSGAHAQNIESGCPISALACEMPRQSQAIRQSATRKIKEFVDVLARQMPDWGTAEAHERALVTMSTMVGALILARAVDEPVMSDSFRTAALQHLKPKQP